MNSDSLIEWISFFGSVGIAMVMSHCCSLMEAAILSITPSQLADIRQLNPKAGRMAHALKHDIDKPLAVILIINTAAHTIGAAVAGASLNALYPGRYMTLFFRLPSADCSNTRKFLPKTLGFVSTSDQQFCAPLFRCWYFFCVP